ncbi:MAG: hypothetical protein AAAC47_01775 [Pararhizobium sp.]
MEAAFHPLATRVTDALARHSRRADVPPTGSAGNHENDKRLAGIFHALTSVEGQTQPMIALDGMHFAAGIYNAKYGIVAAVRRD